MSKLANAALNGDVELVRTLLSSGASPDDLDDKGFGALQNGIISHNIDVVETLLAAGANIARIDATGRPPLIHAIHVEADSARQLGWGTAPLILIELLLKHGADPYQKDSGGRDSFYWADKTAEVHILGLLKAWSKGGN